MHFPALGRQHAYGGRVDIAKKHTLHTALHERDAATLRPDRRCYFRQWLNPGWRLRCQLLEVPGHWQKTLQCHERQGGAQSVGMSEQREDGTAQRTFAPIARTSPFQLRTRAFDQPVVFHT